MIGSTVVRRFAQVRQIRQFSVKSKIHEYRSKFYSNPAVGADNPTYLKEPGDKLVVAVGFTGMTIGVLCIARGLYNMANGINKVSN